MHRRAGIRILGTGLALAVALSVAGPVPAAATELLLYSSRHYPKEPAFEAFTKKTGITLKVFHASDAELFERLKAEGDRTPADLLVTVDAGNLWNAARAGLLGKVDSPEIQANIPAHLRDPESRWVGLVNFQHMLGDPQFWNAVVNTVVIAGLQLVFFFPAPLALALLLHSLVGSTVKRFVQSVVYLPHFLSWVIVVALFQHMLGGAGVVNGWWTPVWRKIPSVAYQSRLMWLGRIH